MRIIVKLILSVFIISSFVSCTQSNKDVKVLKLGHALDVSHPTHKGMVAMADILEKKSGGKMQLKIYPGGQLGAERQCLELLQIGGLDVTKVSSSVMENFAPNFKVLSLPYIFRDVEHSHKVVDGSIGEELLNSATDYWLKGLCFYDAGARSFYTIDKPVLTPADLEGLKIRVMKSSTPVQMVESFGGAPTPISYGELYTSLQQRVVDGAENNPPSLYTSHHYEVCKHYSLDEHAMVPDVLLLSSHTWKKLNDQEKKWLTESAKESVLEQRKIWKDFETNALETMIEQGVKVYYPNKEPFVEKVQGIYREFEKDPEIKELIKKIKETK
ncbi:MAG: TRAP transporter substrate-binding protein [Bacteroidota bacterium]